MLFDSSANNSDSLQVGDCVQFSLDNNLAIDITPFPEVTMVILLVCTMLTNLFLGRSLFGSGHETSQSEGSEVV